MDRTVITSFTPGLRRPALLPEHVWNLQACLGGFAAFRSLWPDGLPIPSDEAERAIIAARLVATMEDCLRWFPGAVLQDDGTTAFARDMARVETEHTERMRTILARYPTQRRVDPDREERHAATAEQRRWKNERMIETFLRAAHEHGIHARAEAGFLGPMPPG